MTRRALAGIAILLALFFFAFACAGYYAYVAGDQEVTPVLIGSGFWAVLGVVAAAVGIHLLKGKPPA
jgi:heme/copper-type cytochrome/quinol oxidase subunit 3